MRISDWSSDVCSSDLNAKVRADQIRRIERVKAERDEGRAQTTLAALREGANGDANLLTLCVEAARARCTLGEMSAALEAAFGRHAVGDRQSTRMKSSH